MLWYAHRNANAVYAYSYTDGYNNADGYSDRNSDSDSYTHADINAQSNAHPEGSAYTEVSSHSGTTTLIFAYEKETHCSTPTSRREHAKNFGVRFF